MNEIIYDVSLPTCLYCLSPQIKATYEDGQMTLVCSTCSNGCRFHNVVLEVWGEDK